MVLRVVCSVGRVRARRRGSVVCMAKYVGNWGRCEYAEGGGEGVEEGEGE